MQTHKLYAIWAVLLSTTMVISMITAQKIMPVGYFSISAANIIFPFAYIISDLVTEVYGFKKSRKIIWLGLFSMVLASMVFQIIIMLPSIPEWQNQEAFVQVLGQTPRIVIASSLAYLCGEFANSIIVSKMKVRSEGKFISLRVLVSSIVAHIIDSVVFVCIAFYGTYHASVILQIITSETVVKFGIECVLMPITILLIVWVKKTEKIDTYDRGIRYSIFSLHG
ncbi:MAG: queuosine precursor transporter [Methylacidiphilales bacterium]|nr:queuosine precursor transporter [Candidatus Methylacidiphilales bacterium]